MCKASAVGEYEPGKAFGAYGSRRNKTVARDCQKEIESGKQPSIPFAKDVVYLPFPERTPWPFQGAGGLSDITEEKESSSEGTALIETTGNDRVKARPVRAGRKGEPLPTLQENQDPAQEIEIVRRVVDKQPTRMRTVRKISNPGRVTAATAPAVVALRVPKDARATQRTRSARDVPREKQETLPEIHPLRVAKPSSRTVQKAEPPVPRQSAPQQSVAQQPPPQQPAPRSTAPQPSSSKSVALIRTVGSEVPATDSAGVLKCLYTFGDNLERALEKKPSNSKRDKTRQLPFVSKWVDYSRKYGVGYVLDDGSVGCLTTATEHFPVTVAFSADGLHHLKQLSKDQNYAKKIPIQLYAAPKKTKGISRIEITEQRRVDDIRSYWQKFGRYMCMQLGDEEWPRKGTEQPNFVKFYQRLGNVGIWGFDDGSFQVREGDDLHGYTTNMLFQFNFPDHTKLVLSSDAGYGKFVCLSVEATAALRETGSVPWQHVKSRETLHGSLQQLLYGSADKEEDSYKELTECNALRAKLKFIRTVINGWIQGGGLGCLEEPKQYEWKGLQVASDRKRHDWASVGRFGGDVF